MSLRSLKMGIIAVYKCLYAYNVGEVMDVIQFHLDKSFTSFTILSFSPSSRRSRILSQCRMDVALLLLLSGVAAGATFSQLKAN